MPKQKAGFTLAEMTIALLVVGMLGAAALRTVAVAQRVLTPMRCEWEGERLMVAPTVAVLPAALETHAALGEAAVRARAIYVLGGSHPSLPNGSTAAMRRPLKRETLPVIANFGAELPLSAHRFYETFHTSLGDENSDAHPDDFSVVMIGPLGSGLGVTLFAQVRRRAPKEETYGEVDRIREVRVWTASGEFRQYAYAERADRAAVIFCGAVHSWYRYSETTGAYEEGPATVSFPDPWALAGDSGRKDTTPPYSRFCHFWPISR